MKCFAGLPVFPSLPVLLPLLSRNCLCAPAVKDTSLQAGLIPGCNTELVAGATLCVCGSTDSALSHSQACCMLIVVPAAVPW